MIYVECKPDEALVRRLTGLGKRSVRHESGKGQVFNRLEKQRNSRALVDEDPGKPQHSYFATMSLARDLPGAGLKVFTDRSKGHRVVLLCPRLEDWIVAAASEAGLDAREHSLLNDPKRLHSVINTNLSRFEALLDALQAVSSQRLNALRTLLVQRPRI